MQLSSLLPSYFSSITNIGTHRVVQSNRRRRKQFFSSFLLMCAVYGSISDNNDNIVRKGYVLADVFAAPLDPRACQGQLDLKSHDTQVYFPSRAHLLSRWKKVSLSMPKQEQSLTSILSPVTTHHHLSCYWCSEMLHTTLDFFPTWRCSCLRLREPTYSSFFLLFL